MWSEKKIGVRQHHCRSCGKALCEKCSKLRTTIPEQGFEFIPVRCCLGCYESITDSDRIPFATSHQLPTDVSLPTGAITTKSGLLCLIKNPLPGYLPQPIRPLTPFSSLTPVPP